MTVPIKNSTLRKNQRLVEGAILEVAIVVSFVTGSNIRCELKWTNYASVMSKNSIRSELKYKCAIDKNNRRKYEYLSLYHSDMSWQIAARFYFYFW